MTPHRSPPCTDPLATLVGVPFMDHGRTREEGLDCWGLYRMAVLLERGVALPSYAEGYADAAEARDNAALIAGLLGDWSPVSDVQRLDAVLMRSGRHAAHIGTVVKRGQMLHTYSGGAVRIEDYRGDFFKERIVGFYRHSQLT